MRKAAPKRRSAAKTIIQPPKTYSARQSPKKAQWAAVAESRFVEGGQSLAAIARSIDVSAKTLRQWAAAGDWAEKRQRYLESPQSQQARLVGMLTFIVDSMDKELRKNKRVDRGDIDSFVKLKKALEYFRGAAYFNAHLVMIMHFLTDYLADRNRPDLVSSLAEYIPGFTPWALHHFQEKR
jgi:transposase-like protein